jgi:hypothetical protein
MTMAGKRKRTSRAGQREDLSKPNVWRRQHGDFEPPSFDTDPDTGAVVVHHRAADTLGIMVSKGTITQEMHDAGVHFRNLFRGAALSDMPTSQLARLPGGVGDSLTEHNTDARRKIAAAIDMLGGHDSAAGSCAWHVLGLETSIREWAMRQGWRGRLVHPAQAQGILTATLSVLAGHFGLLPRSRAA